MFFAPAGSFSGLRHLRTPQEQNVSEIELKEPIDCGEQKLNSHQVDLMPVCSTHVGSEASTLAKLSLEGSFSAVSTNLTG